MWIGLGNAVSLPISLFLFFSFLFSFLCFSHTRAYNTLTHSLTLPPTYTHRFFLPTMHTQIRTDTLIHPSSHPHTHIHVIQTTHSPLPSNTHTHTHKYRDLSLPAPSSGLEVEMLTSPAFIYRTVRVFLALSCHVDRLSGQQGRWVFPGRVDMILSLLLSVCLHACMS
jgi:hypothetical protein